MFLEKQTSKDTEEMKRKEKKGWLRDGRREKGGFVSKTIE